MEHTGNHHVPDSAIDAEAQKIEGYIESGNTAKAIEHLREDAALLDEVSAKRLAEALERANKAAHKTDPNIPEVHLGYANLELNRGKVDHVKFGGQDVDMAGAHDEFKEGYKQGVDTVSYGHNIIDESPYAPDHDDPNPGGNGSAGDRQSEAIITYDVNDQRNPNLYEKAQNGRVAVIHSGIRLPNGQIYGDSEYVVPKDQNPTHLPGATQIQVNGKLYWAIPNPGFRNR